MRKTHKPKSWKHSISIINTLLYWSPVLRRPFIIWTSVQQIHLSYGFPTRDIKFHFTGPLCGESTSQVDSPHIGPVMWRVPQWDFPLLQTPPSLTLAPSPPRGSPHKGPVMWTVPQWEFPSCRWLPSFTLTPRLCLFTLAKRWLHMLLNINVCRAVSVWSQHTNWETHHGLKWFDKFYHGHFAHDIFKCILGKIFIWIAIKNSLKFASGIGWAQTSTPMITQFTDAYACVSLGFHYLT